MLIIIVIYHNRFIKAGLNSDYFRQHVPMIVEETTDFFKKFAKPTGHMDAYETFGSLIIYTASRCLMGKEIRANMDGSVAGLYYDLDQGFKPINFIFPNLPLPSYRRRDIARKKMAELYSSIIQRRKAEGDNVSETFIYIYISVNRWVDIKQCIYYFISIIIILLH